MCIRDRPVLRIKLDALTQVLGISRLWCHRPQPLTGPTFLILDLVVLDVVTVGLLRTQQLATYATDESQQIHPSPRFNCHFPGEPRSASCPLSCFSSSTYSITEPFQIHGTGFFTGLMPFLSLNPQCQSTEENKALILRDAPDSTFLASLQNRIVPDSKIRPDTQKTGTRTRYLEHPYKSSSSGNAFTLFISTNGHQRQGPWSLYTSSPMPVPYYHKND